MTSLRRAISAEFLQNENAPGRLDGRPGGVRPGWGQCFRR